MQHSTTSTLTQEASKVLYNMALQKCHIGDYDTAANLLHALWPLDMQNQVQYMRTLAICYHHQQKWGYAVFFYTLVCMQQEKNHADCLLYMGDCLIKLNRCVEAVQTLQRFMQHYSTNAAYVPLVAKVKLLQLVANKKLAATVN